MHFEVLVEDVSGKTMLETLIPKIIGEEHSFRVIAYKGVGHLPRSMKTASEAQNRALLNQLPRLLKGYGKSFPKGGDYPTAVVLVCDLDDKCLKAFREELYSILEQCNPKPLTRFCIAVEEGEAWYLGDISAVKDAYPNAKDAVLRAYEPDSVIGTWERLADAVYNGGAAALKSKRGHLVGKEKSEWAKNISPYMNVDENRSPSFIHFREKLRELILA